MTVRSEVGLVPGMDGGGFVPGAVLALVVVVVVVVVEFGGATVDPGAGAVVTGAVFVGNGTFVSGRNPGSSGTPSSFPVVVVLGFVLVDGADFEVDAVGALLAPGVVLGAGG